MKTVQPSDRKPFADVLTEVMAYYGKEVSPFQLDVFWQGLKSHEFEDVSRAFTLHARDPDRGQFTPKLADITRLLEGSTTTQGMRAWAKVDRAVRCVGANRSVVFDDPLIHVVIIEMGGWIPLCRSQEDEMPFKAREFEKRYAAYRLRREVPVFPPRLIGDNEAQNKLNGFSDYAVQPVLIGDVGRAQRVMERGQAVPALRITDSKTVAGHVLAHLVDHCKGEAA
ncbi:hypothetical protein EO087_00100 [Dyella sp. M7H15-1]|uniref:DUF6475 domain-containing protein n=1 Tax=Dyella sp. M7H15-1 TaxID=2501295 RepID=UPI001004EE20|nr:DUF6475 domain-containing protein [Dyella sp. M7H15-1]QAU22570.1 hypothetical protein EO087_00100 [Dyella sp. M7H15-1]